MCVFAAIGVGVVVAGFVFDAHLPKDSRKSARSRQREVRELFEARLRSGSEDEVEVLTDFPKSRPSLGSMSSGSALNLRSLRVTSARYGAAIPFLADSGTGVEGARIGRNLTGGDWFHFDPWIAYQKGWVTGTSIVQIGGVGAGKSTTAKATARREIAQGRKVAVPSDPKGEWGRVAATVKHSQVLEIGHRGQRINPLDEGIKPDGVGEEEWLAELHTRRQQLLIAIISVMNEGRPFAPQQHTALDVALKRVCQRTSTPTIRLLIDQLFNPLHEDLRDVGDVGEDLGHSLKRAVSGDLAGMFDQESTVKFGENTVMMVISTRTLLNKPHSVKAVASALTSFWVDSVVRDPRSGYWIVISEEGWSEMRDPKAVELLDERQRLAGEFGLANWLIMHEISDLDMVGSEGSSTRAQALGLLSKAQIKIVHRQSESAIEPTQRALRLSDREAEQVLNLRQGQALWKIGSRSLVVETLITAEEYRAFNTSGMRAGK